MKKFFLLYIPLIFFFLVARPQSFTGSGGALGATSVQKCFPVTVSGVGVINSTKGLSQVCLNISHAQTSELEIVLKSPDGTVIPLSIENGAGGNYTNTCFTSTAATSVRFGANPFSGTYLPEGYLGEVNDGQNANGIWNICIVDRRGTTTGSLTNFTLTFSNTPAPPPPVKPACTTIIPASSSCASATAVCDFNGLCGSTSGTVVHDWTGSGLNKTSGNCFTLENNSFIKFVASSSTVSFSVWVNSSTSGYPLGGIQMKFFSGTCDVGTVTSYACYDHILPNSSVGNPTLTIVSANSLIPGNTYYLMTDGFNGDKCDFTIAANSGINILDITPSAPAICSGQSVNLTASGGNNVFSWSPATDLNATTGPTVTASPTVDTKYTVTSSGIGSCPITKDVTVTVNALPVINTHPSTSAQNVCLNEATTDLSIAASAGSGTISTYQWYSNTTASNTGGTLISGANGASFTPPSGTAGTLYYYCVVSNSNTCSTTSNISGAININPLPATPTASVTAQPTCSVPTGTIDITAPLNVNYEYSDGGTYQAGTSFTGLSPNTYLVTVKNTTTGCNSLSKSLTVSAVPGAPVTPAASITPPSCSVATGSLTVTSPTGINYEYNLTGTYQAGTGFTNIAPGSYTLFAKDISTGCSSSLPVNISSTGIATASTTTIAECISYTWNGVTYNSSGTYTKLFANGNSAGCDSTATLKLTIKNPTTSTTTIAECKNYTWNGITYNTSGTYTKLFANGNAVGCDSTATLKLTIKNPTTSTSTVAECNSYLWNGITYNTSGTYTKLFTNGNSVGCDSTATLKLTIKNPTSSSDTKTACNSYTWNGVTYNSSGTYTKLFVNGNSVGCDSTATLKLTINTPTSGTSTITECNSYTWNGITYNTSGTYTKLFPNGNAAGCDSTATLKLTITKPTTSSTTVAECNSYIWNGFTYSSSGTYTKLFANGNAAGCDSTATLKLTIKNSTTSTTTKVACNSYTWNGVTYTASGTYTKLFANSNAVGCDSTATLNLTINTPTSSTQNISACKNYTWNGVIYSSSGTYTKVLPNGNAAGCDSTATLNLTINAPSTGTSTISACDSYVWNGVTYTTSGTYTKLFTNGNAAGCDSTDILKLTINKPTTNTATVAVCTSYTWNGVTYTTSGTYTKVFPNGNAKGCDSTAILKLTIKIPTTGTSTISTCNSYRWNGITYTTSGTYTKVFPNGNSAGCDSTATLNLTINLPASSTTNIAACTSYTWNGVTYTTSGTYTKIFPNGNAAGCDSAATLKLTITKPTVSTTNITACDDYTWNGVTYNTSGIYTKLFSNGNAAGCDSTATLKLTIKNSSASITIKHACTSFAWNGTVYTASGTYSKTLRNSVGCDSVATLELTVGTASTSTQAVTECNSYTWNGTVYTASGTYSKKFPNANASGCDSTAILKLTIVKPTTGTTTQRACNQFIWNGVTYTASGTYTKTFPNGNSNGCDSIAILKLTIGNPTVGSTNANACSKFKWNGITYTASGTYTKTLTNSNGCDSVATLNLIINTPTTDTTVQFACSNFTWNGVAYNSSGTYTKTLVNATGCDSLDVLKLTINELIQSSELIHICPNQLPYLWNGRNFSSAGTYQLTLKNTAGCDSVAILDLKVFTTCNDIYFPSGFSPNKDGVNDAFGPIGDLNAIFKYTLYVYDRWGKLVFKSTNPFEKWDGTVVGNDADSNNFVWVAAYTYNGQSKKLKGNVVLIR